MTLSAIAVKHLPQLARKRVGLREEPVSLLHDDRLHREMRHQSVRG